MVLLLPFILWSIQVSAYQLSVMLNEHTFMLTLEV